MVTARYYLIPACLLVLMLGLFSPLLAAEIKVFVDQDELRVDQSFQVFFEATESVDDDPDFSPLQQDFEILSRNVSSSSSFINGSFSSKKTWIVTLLSKRDGHLQIPPISFGSDRSSALLLSIGKQNAPTSGQNQEIYLEVEVEPESVYVEQQFIYKVQLFRRVEITNASLSEPDFSTIECNVEKIGDDLNFDTIINGRRYLVVERKYAVFPQQSGLLTIKPIRFKGQLVQAQRSFFGPINQAGPIRRISSDSLEIEIKPVPAAFTGQRWLPAEQLRISEDWSVDPAQLTTGEPATRTLTITASGVQAHLLPEISPQSVAGFKLYPDQAKFENDTDKEPSSAQRIEKVAFIPTQGGSFQLSEIRIDWWNTKTDQQETAVLPARSLMVTAPQTTPPIAPPQQLTEKPQLPAPTPAPAVSPEPATEHQTPAFWIITCAFLAGGWLLTSIGWWRSTRKKSTPSTTAKKPDFSDTKKMLKTACEINDPITAGNSLLKWGKQQWPKNPPSNLTAIGERCHDLAEEIEFLNRALYAQDAISWDGKQLWQLISKRSVTDEKTGSSKQSPLADLYIE